MRAHYNQSKGQDEQANVRELPLANVPDAVAAHVDRCILSLTFCQHKSDSHGHASFLIALVYFEVCTAACSQTMFLISQIVHSGP